jgi:hypothetical protein
VSGDKSQGVPDCLALSAAPDVMPNLAQQSKHLSVRPQILVSSVSVSSADLSSSPHVHVFGPGVRRSVFGCDGHSPDS